MSKSPLKLGGDKNKEKSRTIVGLTSVLSSQRPTGSL